MANEFYITAGLVAQDSAGAIGANAFYMTAGLVANDYAAGGGKGIAVIGGIQIGSLRGASGSQAGSLLPDDNDIKTRKKLLEFGGLTWEILTSLWGRLQPWLARRHMKGALSQS